MSRFPIEYPLSGVGYNSGAEREYPLDNHTDHDDLEKVGEDTLAG